MCGLVCSKAEQYLIFCTMASRTIFITFLTLTVLSLVIAEWEMTANQSDEEGDNNLTFDDLQDFIISKRNNVQADRFYFLKELMDVDKRGRRILGCKLYISI